MDFEIFLSFFSASFSHAFLTSKIARNRERSEGEKHPYIKLVPTGQKEPKDLSFEPNPPITILSDIVEEAE